MLLWWFFSLHGDIIIILFAFLHFGTLIDKVSKSAQAREKRKKKQRKREKVREKIGDTQIIHVYHKGKFLKFCIWLNS